MYPPVPESAAVKVNGELRAYVPPASCTTMSPVIVGAIPRTVDCAWPREQGWADEQAVPEPVGETYTVVITAACAGAAATSDAAASNPAAQLENRAERRGFRRLLPLRSRATIWRPSWRGMGSGRPLGESARGGRRERSSRGNTGKSGDTGKTRECITSYV
ncbi:hypothetical protein Cs7R123_10820 [Catellatospora sp. TT07R-123]|nr:hypothetical protein Cs7R123_10820 [Catellatospora sp. TT07R-123]